LSFREVARIVGAAPAWRDVSAKAQRRHGDGKNEDGGDPELDGQRRQGHVAHDRQRRAFSATFFWPVIARTRGCGYPDERSEMLMPNLFDGASALARAAALAAVLLLGIWFVSNAEPAAAAPGFLSDPTSGATVLEQAQFFRRGRPPIYPYYYSPGRPGGYSFYFGFVPYEKGDYEIQALQRKYPEANYPPSMRYWTPRSGF
jgi:hypothetical protein